MANNSPNGNDPYDDRDGFDKFFDGLSKSFSKLSKIGQELKPTPQNEFFRAIRMNRTTVVRRMLKEGFTPDSYNTTGKTALQIAILNDARDVARLLLDKGANPRLGDKDEPEHTPLADAIDSGKPWMTELLVQRGAYTPGELVNGASPLHYACKKGDVRSAGVLIKAGAPANEKTESGLTPLLIAITHNHSELAEALLKIPYVLATMNERFTTADGKERTPLQLAVERGNTYLVSHMAKKGGDISSPNADGIPPLLTAIESGRSEMVRVLAEAGADLNQPCGPGGTPLAYACKSSSIASDFTRAKMIDILIRLGADADIPAPDGKVPLHYLLSTRKPVSVLSALLRYPVSRDVPDNKGVTPLIEAVRHNNLTGVQALLQAGANPKLFDAQGKSALSYARESGRVEIIDALERALNKKPPGKNFPSP